MTIKASSGRQVDRLIADLKSDRAVVRDAAVARLAVIGTRAVERLARLALDSTAPSAARVSAVRALEGIEDPRKLETGSILVNEGDVTVAIAAVALLRPALTGPHGVGLVDCLTTVALDRARSEQLREAAIRALADLEPRTIAPLLTALASDENDLVRSTAARLESGDRREPESAPTVVAAAAHGTLSDDADVLRKAILDGGETTPLADLRALVDVIREREASSAASSRRAWTQARGTVHATLARRNSRLAVFDLRDTLTAADAPLPVDFIAALVAIGDASCLEPIAAAIERSLVPRVKDALWTRHLTEAFQVIRSRERVTVRHGVMKRIEKRWPAAFEQVRGR
ncbi:MAG: HEAT repeat domain-containing protein [Vicinamibacterales bacterium]